MRGGEGIMDGMPVHLRFSKLEFFLIRSSLSIICQLFDAVDILSLIRLGSTSKALRRLFLCYAQSTWDPAKCYRRWFADVLEFRRILRKSNAVVSGSFALQFFDRTFYPESDMDIFTRVAGVSVVCDFLISEGYQCDGHSEKYEQHSYEKGNHFLKAVMNVSSYDDPLLGVYAFRKFVGSGHGRIDVLHVQVVVVDTDPIEHVLFDFHSTVVLNFLTADDAISVFPLATFIHRLSYISKIRREPADRSEGWISKYRGRGFKFIGAENVHEARHVPAGVRYAGDKFSWRIGLLRMWHCHPVMQLVCLFTLAESSQERGLYGAPIVGVAFEVLTLENTAVTKGSYLRIAEPYVWR
ncbi:hypothetical protein CVT26_012204 [Gymnopilus dilepis]|uniref:Uncharacterized protein n=1 Tax=Gymnopilus dilepis TaxID=231916 RepID=A0A409YCB2_9AGAR|nr:hypothetical protein CVT26_012204 [Gymnopilus dilepis]